MNTIEIREESGQTVYINGQPEFVIKANGSLKWFRLTEATQQDFNETINLKSENV